jgi:hypothetical protein
VCHKLCNTAVIAVISIMFMSDLLVKRKREAAFVVPHIFSIWKCMVLPDLYILTDHKHKHSTCKYCITVETRDQNMPFLLTSKTENYRAQGTTCALVTTSASISFGNWSKWFLISVKATKQQIIIKWQAHFYTYHLHSLRLNATLTL